MMTSLFNCYKLDTPEGASAQLVAGDKLGLITVIFKPALVSKAYKIYRSEGVTGQSLAGTGLSGISSQKFHEVSALDYDESHVTTIHLRLVVIDDDKPRPLTPVSPIHETVIPATV